ncbi:hypothetical protein FZ938_11850 [Azospirillum oryzae]|nr:hypothetical protein FZ938_11850 [Azospirillum oryzae]
MHQPNIPGRARRSRCLQPSRPEGALALTTTAHAAPHPIRFVHCNTQPFPECRAVHHQPSAYKIVRATKTPLRSS